MAVGRRVKRHSASHPAQRRPTVVLPTPSSCDAIQCFQPEAIASVSEERATRSRYRLKSIVGITSAAKRAAAANFNTLNRKSQRPTTSHKANVPETGRVDNVEALVGDRDGDNSGCSSARTVSPFARTPAMKAMLRLLCQQQQ